MPAVDKSIFRKPLRKNSKKIPLPEYGDDAYVIAQALTSKDIAEVQKVYGSNPDSANVAFVHELFFRCFVGDDGSRIFSSVEEVGNTIEFSLPAMEQLVEECLSVSGISSKRDDVKN